MVYLFHRVWIELYLFFGIGLLTALFGVGIELSGKSRSVALCLTAPSTGMPVAVAFQYCIPYAQRRPGREGLSPALYYGTTSASRDYLLLLQDKNGY